MNEQMSMDEIEVSFRGTLGRVQKMLEENEDLRNSDRKLIWEYWKTIDRITSWNEQGEEVIYKKDFVEYATPYDTIARSARTVRHLCPWLGGKDKVKELRRIRKEAARRFFKNR